MSDGKYWELFGDVRKVLLDIVRRRDAAFNDVLKFAKRNGAQGYATSTSFTTQFFLDFKEAPDTRIWKKLRQHPYWVPKVSTKEGKQLDRELDLLRKACPGASEIDKAVGFKDCFRGGHWYTLGYKVVGKRVILSAPEHYEPPAKLAADIRRISDVTVEALTKKLTTKKKQKTVKR